jgi:hypothetical protein
MAITSNGHGTRHWVWIAKANKRQSMTSSSALHHFPVANATSRESTNLRLKT